MNETDQLLLEAIEVLKRERARYDAAIVALQALVTPSATELRDLSSELAEPEPKRTRLPEVSDWRSRPRGPQPRIKCEQCEEYHPKGAGMAAHVRHIHAVDAGEGLASGSGQSGASSRVPSAEPVRKNPDQALVPTEPSDYQVFGTPPDVPTPTRQPSTREGRRTERAGKPVLEKLADRVERKSFDCPYCGQNFITEARLNTHKSGCSKRDTGNTCRFCQRECGSYKTRQEHEQLYCEKRLQERTSTQHVHEWALGRPQGMVVLGKCKGCGTVKEFPADNHTEDWGGRKPARTV